jgi:hypothetical protein
MRNLLLIFIILVFTGCSSIIHNYNKQRVFVGSYKLKDLPSNFEIGKFEYIPSPGINKNEFLFIGLFSNESREFDTNISEIVENEVRKFSNKYVINKNSKKCILSGEIYELSWNSINGDTTSRINYQLSYNGKLIDKIEINHIWEPSIFTMRTIPQKLSFSIHGNINELTKNTNFKDALNKYCKMDK